MKKLLTAVLAALLCICLSCTALADTSAALVHKFDHALTLVSKTNLLMLTGNEGHAIASLDGTLLVEPHYGMLLSYHGWLSAADYKGDDVNCYGLFDYSGKEIIPFIYGDLKVMSHEWVIGIKLAPATSENYDYTNSDKDKFYLVGDVDIYHLPEGKVASLTRDQYIDAYVAKDCLNIQDRATGVVSTYDAAFNKIGTDCRNIYDESYAVAALNTFRENGQTGLKDAAGNVVLEPCYKYIDTILGDYAVVDTGSTHGVIRLDGTVIVPAEYDDIKTLFTRPLDQEGNSKSLEVLGYFCVIKDKKVGYMDLNGTTTVEPKYAKDICTVNGASYTLTDLTGATLIVAADGVETSVSGYAKVTALEYGSGVYYSVRTDDFLYGVIDWHGNVILPAEFSSLKITGDGQYIVATRDYNKGEIYQLTYPAGVSAATAAPEAPVADAPAADAPVVSDNPAVSVLNTAITLLTADPAANGVAVSALLDSAAALNTDASAAAILTSAKVLVDTDPAANAASVITLLNTVIGLIK